MGCSDGGVRLLAFPSHEPGTCSCEIERVKVSFASEELISRIGLTLEGWVTSDNKQPQALSPFHCIQTPPESVKDYLERIHVDFECSDECYIIALIIIDRVRKIEPALRLCKHNVHLLLVSAVMLAAKFHDDLYYSNAYYAEFGGLPLMDLNQLEAILLKSLDWRVNVTSGEYQDYLRIVRKATGPRSIARSFSLMKKRGDDKGCATASYTWYYHSSLTIAMKLSELFLSMISPQYCCK